MLDALATAGVQGTFFPTGHQAEADGPTLAQIAAQGHIIGASSWDGEDLTGRGAAQIRSELADSSAAVESATQASPSLVRVSSGSDDATLLSVLRESRQASISADVDESGGTDSDPLTLAQAVLDGVRPGSIVALDATASSTADAIPSIVSGLRAEGYELVTVPVLLGGDVQPGAHYTRGLAPAGR